MPLLDYQAYHHIVVLTGAGLSVGSGLPTYRGKNGLWKDGRVDPRATAQGIKEDLMGCWELFLPLRAGAKEAQPNDGHRALATFEASLPSDCSFTLITQNVDGLHKRAGSRNVVELHGNILRSRCNDENCQSASCEDERDYQTCCTTCGGRLRPDIVLFGEMIPLDASWPMKMAMREVDLFLSIGTSGTVLPAATMVDYANENGAMTVEFNVERSGKFRHFVEGPAEVTVPQELGGVTGKAS